MFPHASGFSAMDTVVGHDYTSLVTGVVSVGRSGVVTSRHAIFKEYSGPFNVEDAC